MLSEREGERNGFLGNITRSPLCRAFTCWASNSLPSTEKNSGNTKRYPIGPVTLSEVLIRLLKKRGLFTVSSNNRFEIWHRALPSRLQRQRAKASRSQNPERHLSELHTLCYFTVSLQPAVFLSITWLWVNIKAVQNTSLFISPEYMQLPTASVGEGGEEVSISVIISLMRYRAEGETLAPVYSSSLRSVEPLWGSSSCLCTRSRNVLSGGFCVHHRGAPLLAFNQSSASFLA